MSRRIWRFAIHQVHSLRHQVHGLGNQVHSLEEMDSGRSKFGILESSRSKDVLDRFSSCLQPQSTPVGLIWTYKCACVLDQNTALNTGVCISEAWVSSN
ncbi:hypothetical protein PoB_002097300 [Plakobranchus ocellatus]|uniref:Uncharacterized protein n=1 Tax=Plakobranchus ocellatus TaxID=259542 RepID=A0AAV3ZIY6_9GAST|nr:hypothetical protein PoB_002097300 [Plakobranchus ocellatus]